VLPGRTHHDGTDERSLVEAKRGGSSGLTARDLKRRKAPRSLAGPSQFQPELD
jgi:hypothetical protein